MKTLKKISINPEKVIKNEELVNLKGGAYDYACYCNGHYLGDRDTAMQCASLCAACTSCW
jgi:natural product precursor